MKLRGAVLVFVVLGGAAVAVAQPAPGSVSGTVSLIAEDGRFAGLASFARIEVVVDEMRGEFAADEVGQFSTRLPAGRYTVVGVVGCRGERLMLDGMELRAFEIRPGRAVRFDVMVRAPAGVYQCPAQRR